MIKRKNRANRGPRAQRAPNHPRKRNRDMMVPARRSLFPPRASIPNSTASMQWSRLGNKGNDTSADFGTAVVDPSDDLTVWMAHQYGDKVSSNYKTIIGRVRP